MSGWRPIRERWHGHRGPKIVGNASLSHELALSASTFGAEEALLLLGLVSRVVPGSRAEAVRAVIGVCEGRRVGESCVD